MQYVYIFAFLFSIPLVWNVLYCLRFENLFKQGRVWQIRLAFILVTLICSHLLAEMIYTFSNAIYALF